jgi:Ca2+-binding RTX toxin-like protein
MTAALALPTAAIAATSVELGSDQLTVTGDAFANDITVRRVSDGYIVTDPLAPLAPATVPACRFTTTGDIHEVKCTRTGEVDVVIGGRAGQDTLKMLGGTVGARLAGENGDDTLVGGPGPDALRGGDGADSLRGGGGLDTATYSERSAGVSVTLPVDSLDVRADDGNSADGGAGARDTIFTDVENAVGGAGRDSLLGNNAANLLDGRDNADTLSGRGGDDRLDGGLGPDIMVGNTGVDRVLYDDRTKPVNVTLDGLSNDGNPIDDVILNASGVPPADNVDVENVTGGDAADTLVGSSAANQLSGRSGDDTLDGANGSDDLDGGEGQDALEGGGGGDDVSGGSGVDRVSYATSIVGVRVSLDGVADDGNAGDAFTDNIRSDVERLTGTSFNDVLRGSENADFLDGGSGKDVIEGAGGDDVLRGGAADDVLDGGDGEDTAEYQDHDAPVVVTLDGIANDGTPDTKAAGTPFDASEHDNVLTEDVTGTEKADVITGDDGDNELRGEGGDDTLRGGGGRDRLRGDDGVDRLLGEGGPDAVVAFDGVHDEVDCGPDIDILEADLADRGPNPAPGDVVGPEANCEQQLIGPVGTLPNVTLAAKAVRIAGRDAFVKLRCPRHAQRRCVGTVRLQRLDGATLGRAHFAIRRGGRATVAVPLNRRVRRGAAQIRARERAADGRPKVTLLRVRLTQTRVRHRAG